MPNFTTGNSLALTSRIRKPWWEPGIQSGYHAITQGYLIGEVIRRITGRTIGTYFREEVAEKIGVDFHIGVPPVRI